MFSIGNYFNIENKKAFRRPTERALLQAMMRRYTAWHFLHDDPEQAPYTIHRLGEIDVPTLAILGDLDMPYWHRAFDAISTGIPDSQTLRLPGLAISPISKPPTGSTQRYSPSLRRRQ